MIIDKRTNFCVSFPELFDRPCISGPSSMSVNDGNQKDTCNNSII